ncbi:hypothetical protein AZE42_04905 [Rhizopogon vesiculosus]|uniref:Uncharacterized protein n=1 Tax=Rhizopogon vesiculosus TaxID=180088 RepID=A0A1J8RFE0_9AGAM|nr:hypothetical protein AZE42_04905 [Rhizopogon vesiculosus]
MLSRLYSLASGSSTLEKIVQLSAAAVIIFERSFYLWDERRYLEDKKEFGHPINLALEQYMASPNATAIRDALSSAVHAYQATSSPWKKTLIHAVTDGFTHRRAELINSILKVTLQYRMPIPSPGGDMSRVCR